MLRAVVAACALAMVTVPAVAQFEPDAIRVAVGTTTGSGGEDMEHFGRGIGDLLVNDLIDAISERSHATKCAVRIVEWRRRAEALAEIDLRNSRFAAPGQKLEYPPEPKILVEGTVAQNDGLVSWSMVLKERATGEILGTSTGSLPEDQMMDSSMIIARDLIAALCPKGWTISGGGARIVVTGHVASIDAPFTATGAFPGGTASFIYTPTGAEGGTVSYTLAGGGVTGAGEGTYSIAASDGGAYVIQQTTNGCITGIPNSCKTNSETLTLTPDAK
jgi:hypothetical protein